MGGTYVAPSQPTQTASASQDLLPPEARRGSSEAALGLGEQFLGVGDHQQATLVHERVIFSHHKAMTLGAASHALCRSAGLELACFLHSRPLALSV